MRYLPMTSAAILSIAAWVGAILGGSWEWAAVGLGMSILAAWSLNEILREEEERGSIEELLRPYGTDRHDVSDSAVRVVPREEK